MSFAIAYNAPLSGFPFLVSFSSLIPLPGITSQILCRRPCFRLCFQWNLRIQDTDLSPKFQQVLMGFQGMKNVLVPQSVLCYVHWRGGGAGGGGEHHLKIDNCVLFCRQAEDSNPGHSLSGNSEGLLRRKETRYIGGFATKPRWLKHQKITAN